MSAPKRVDTKQMNYFQQEFAIPYSYKVFFTKHLFDPKNPIFINTLKEDGNITVRKLVFIIDSKVAEHHPNLSAEIDLYCRTFSSEIALAAPPMIITGGETAKNNFQFVHDILLEIDTQKIDRHAYVIAIGGGAILDLVGFAAAIAHRGVRHIRIPTTVLSQNDSGVGVKNGINYFDKKNYLGTFVPPFAVINDTNFLLTLEQEEWRSGISEAIKVALIRDTPFFEWIDAHTTALVNRDMQVMEELIYRCAEHHLNHISTQGDPFEKGSSRPLDFGHWAAHKLEQITNYQIRHGEAVAVGIALDVAYSYHLGILERDAMIRIHQCILNLGFDLTPKELWDESGTTFNPEIWHGLEEFREHLGGQLTIMLIDKIGHGIEIHELDKTVLNKAVKELQSTSSK